MPKEKNARATSDTDDNDVASEEEPEFIVEKILDSRTKAGKTEFLLRWKGYPE